MATIDYPEPVRILITQLKRLPGIGPKSAERIAVWMLQQGKEWSGVFVEAVGGAGRSVVECATCGFFASLERGCAICDGIERDRSRLCVVEQPADILPLERSGAYRGQYHALRGRISPLDNIGPDDLRIAELIERLKEEAFEEVILALRSDVEGEATANYLGEILREFPSLVVSRLAQGMPAGAGLDSADELTLMRALEGRIGVR